ncbi:bifunctional hydroxylase/dehydrase [Nocardia transvalensis]|uniref:Bifunctional hydroxylase/dehydrase n=1 Tax=Nocardia transvalensis TaxID=37333 RepID=A0A7W9PLG0_9NOCA|nr:FAD-dependent monooxygenase [Nocardia transvalensis]MBB5918322.1 bifunctional hydroxylase/dehydrase [Nocardia transvalensis]
MNAEPSVEINGGVPAAQEVPVVIVGIGPTGLMLASELRLWGVDCLVIGTSVTPETESRALGFTPSTQEIFAHRDMLREFGELERLPAVHFAGIVISAEHVASPYKPVMRFPQYRTEGVLRARAARLGATLAQSYTVTDIRESGEGLETIADGPDGTIRVRSHYVIGCDGAHSTVRGIASLGYSLTPPSVQMLLADVEHAGLPNNPFGKRTSGGMVMSGPLDDRVDRLIVCDFHAEPLERGVRVEESHLKSAYKNVTGDDLPPGKIRWASYFNDASGMAPSFRNGSLLLAGDAAHTHLPAGGQGMNVSIQDAVNLGWKLAAAVRGWAPAGLLDTYDAERRQAARELLDDTRAQGQLFLGSQDVDPLRELLTRLAATREAAEILADEVTGMALRYDFAHGSPEPVGRLLPTANLRLPHQDTPPLGLLRHGRGAFVTPGGDPATTELLSRWRDRVELTTTATPDDTEFLVRPDGYVAWTSHSGEPLTDAIERWFGPAVQHQ